MRCLYLITHFNLEEIEVILMGRKINSGLSSGVHGQLSFENFELLKKLNKQADIGDIVVSH